MSFLKPLFLSIFLTVATIFNGSASAQSKNYTGGANFKEYNGIRLKKIPIPNYDNVIGSGSGLTIKGTSKADLRVYLLTDRGPNLDGPNAVIDSKNSKTKIFPDPKFNPKIVDFKINLAMKKPVPTGIDVMTIRDKKGKKIIGLPPIGMENFHEIAIDKSLNPINPSRTSKGIKTEEKFLFSGVDPEGIAIQDKDYFWVCEEYLPSLLKINSRTGRIVKRVSPYNTLPKELLKRQPNRGFEAITILDSGEIVVAMQSPYKDENVIKVLVYNDATKKSHIFSLEIPRKFRKDYLSYKIGDFSLLEKRKVVYVDNWKGDKSIRIFTVPEASELGSLSQIDIVESEKIYSINQDFWNHKKTEGLAVLPDKKSLLLINDDDFQIEASVNWEKQLENFSLSLDTQKNENQLILPIKAKRNIIKVTKSPRKELELLYISFPKPLVAYAH